MLAIIESLVGALLMVILELFLNIVVYGILYNIVRLISTSMKAASDTVESLADAAKTPKTQPLIITLLIVGGIMVALAISFTFPKRVLDFGSITGISLLITPLLIGMFTSFIGRWEKSHNKAPSFMATFLGGAIFGLAAAGTRLIFIIQSQ
tara:strand:+ start:141 stop:593 length:453 start_codon:yes stop_codon:yes gene_type:complete